MIKNILVVAGKDLSILLKDKTVLAIYFLMPLLFASLLGMAFGNTASGETKIEVATLAVNQDGGQYGQMVVDALKQATVLKISELADAAQADEQVADGKAAAAIVIPADFSTRIDAGEPAEIVAIQDPTQPEAAQIAAGITNQAMAEIGLVGELRYGIHAVLSEAPGWDQASPELQQAAEAQSLGVVWSQVQQMRQNPVIAVKSETVTGVEEEPWNPVTFYVPGFAVAFAFFLIAAMAASLLEEKEDGTFRRLLCSPIPHASIIGGKMLTYMVIVFLQVLVLFGVGYALFKMPLGRSPLALVLLTLALACCASALGMLLGAVSPTSKRAGTVGQILGFILMILGGTIFPLFRSEGLMGTLSRLTPNAWGIEGYMGLLGDNATLVQVAPNILILFGFAAVFFAIAVWRFKFE